MGLARYNLGLRPVPSGQCSVRTRSLLADNISPVHVTDELVGLIANSGKTPLRYLLNTGHMIIIEDVHGTALAINRLLEKLR